MPKPNRQPDPKTEITRRRILNAARRLFEERGYQRTTTRAIAAKAGVNEVTIFRHFRTKKNLLLICVEETVAVGLAAPLLANRTGDYATDILLLARAQKEAMLEGYSTLRMLLCEASTLPEVRTALLRRAHQNYSQRVDYFRRQIEAGIVRPELSPETLAQAFDSLFATALFFQLVFQFDSISDAAAEAMLDQRVDIFVQGTLNR